ncbi:hypothetical protein ABBQ32_010909 [Trebouxia sp. C0010 RCD-2024]
MPGPPDVSGKPKANNVYAQKVVVKQAVRSHAADQTQDAQKQRLLPMDSPRSPSSPRPQHAQPLSNHSPRQAQQQPQQRQPQLPQQASDQSDDDWTWPQTSSSPTQQAFEVPLQAPAVSQLAQNGSPNAASRPKSASFAERVSPGAQDSEGSQHSGTLSRPRTGTASPRITSDALVSSKNVSWQDAQGQNLCQYREFEPSDMADSDDDDTTWHAQKKGCCMIM